MKKILVILGSTSTGKTDLALSLAKKFNGELVNCDSRQVYKGLDIGTGKIPSGIYNLFFKLPSAEQFTIYKKEKYWEIDGIKIWMYDVAELKSQYTVADYVKDANKAIDDIEKRGKLPIIIGGTGLYLKALLEGLSNLAIPVDKVLRKKLQKLSKEQLQKKLQQASPDKWNSLNESDKQNSRRLIRSIEILLQSKVSGDVHINTTVVGLMSTIGKVGLQEDMLKIGLTAPREILYQKIDERVVSRINQGMIDEAKRLHKKGLTFKRMRQLGLEYGVLVSYLEGKIVNKEELIKMMQGKVHGFTRHQLTWFKKEKQVYWFDITDKEYVNKIEELANKWYDTPTTYAAKD